MKGVAVSLMDRIARGEADGLSELYDRTSRLVYSLALRILRRPEEAEDVVVEVYEKALREAAGYDPGRGSVESWLVALTRTRALERVRARSARTLSSIPHPEGKSGENIVDDRRLIEMVFFDGYTPQELSTLLRIPVEIVTTRIRSGMQNMRRALATQPSQVVRFERFDRSRAESA